MRKLTTWLEGQEHITSWFIDLIGIALLGLLFFSLFLGAYPLHLPDEGRYAEVAREMLSQHNYITPMLNGVLFFDKPPLYYWLSAAAMHLMGVNEWGARAASLCFGLFGLLGIYTTGRLIDNRRTGLLAAGILATTPLYFLGAHFANCDLIVAVCISLSLWSVLIAVVRSEVRLQRWFMFSAYIWCALAILAKGLIGIVFPIAVIGLFVIIYHRWHFIKQMHLVLGLLLVLLLVLPWFIAVSHANPNFLHYFFYVQHFQRFTSQSFNDREPFWFYVPIVILGSWPWVLYLAQTIKSHVKNQLSSESRRINGFLWIWVAVIFIFFSIPSSKTIGYILPIFLPLALLLARYLSALVPGVISRFPAMISLVVLSIVGLGLLVIPYIVKLNDVFTMTTTLWAVLFMAFGFVGFWWYQRKQACLSILLGVNALLLVSILAFAHMASSNSTKNIAIWLDDHHIAVTQIYSYYNYPFDLPFYLQAPIKVVYTNWQEPGLSERDSWKGEFAYGLLQSPQINTNFVNQADFIKQWQAQQPIYVLIRTKQSQSFEAAMGASTLTRLYTSGAWSLVTNGPAISQ